MSSVVLAVWPVGRPRGPGRRLPAVCKEWNFHFSSRCPAISGHSFPTGSRWFWRLLQQKPKLLKQTGGREKPWRSAGSTRINILIQWRILHVDWRVLLVTDFRSELCLKHDYDQSPSVCSAKRTFSPGSPRDRPARAPPTGCRNRNTILRGLPL